MVRARIRVRYYRINFFKINQLVRDRDRVTVRDR